MAVDRLSNKRLDIDGIDHIVDCSYGIVRWYQSSRVDERGQKHLVIADFLDKSKTAVICSR